MSTEIDLNVENYSSDELRIMMGVRENATLSDIYQQYSSKLKEILSRATITDFDRKSYNNFLSDVKERLVDGMSTVHPLVDHVSHYPNLHVNPVNSGYLNPIQRNVCVVQLNFNSRFRPNYYSTNTNNFYVTLPNPLRNVISMRLASMELPNVDYEISAEKGTNQFTYTTNTGTVITAVIPDGNYSLFTFKSVFENASPDLELDITNAETTGKLNISIRAGSPITMFSLNFKTDRSKQCKYITKDSPPETLGTFMGFIENTYIDITTVNAEGIPGFSGSKYLYFSVEDYRKSMYDVVMGVFEQNYLVRSILAKINLPSTKNMINFNNDSDRMIKKRQYFGPVNLERFHFQLLNETGELINNQNTNYSFALEFEILYKY